MTRRDCLNWLARAAAVAAAYELCPSVACADDKDKKKDKDKEKEKEKEKDKKGQSVKAADLFSIRNDTAIEITKPSVFLTRTNAGVAALATYCTHKRHRLEIEEGCIVCPVHGSNFDNTGKPTSGPANKPLPWYLSSIDDNGAIFVDTSKTVERGSWAALPDWAKPKK
jgi:Rieske Fe-S protein